MPEDAVRSRYLSPGSVAEKSERKTFYVGTSGKRIKGTCGINAGARTVFNALVDEIEERALKGVRVTRTGCLGSCSQEPSIEVHIPGKEVVKYANLDAKKAVEIIEKHIIGGNVCTEYLAKA